MPAGIRTISRPGSGVSGRKKGSLSGDRARRTVENDLRGHETQDHRECRAWSRSGIGRVRHLPELGLLACWPDHPRVRSGRFLRLYPARSVLVR